MVVESAKKTSIDMGATVLLFAVVTAMSFAAAVSSEDRDIVMVVDEPQLSYSGGVQHVHSKLPVGKSLKLSRGRLGCVGTGESCGWFSYCCTTLSCDSGTCKQIRECVGLGENCIPYPEEYDNCCYPLQCTDSGQCKPLMRAVLENFG